MILEAAAFWQWANYCASRVPAGRRQLRINFDETAVCLYQGHARGNIFLAKTDQTRQNVPRWKRRAYLTHVAFACDGAAVPNEACVLNDIEVQNYVLQLPITGGSVLPLSNYVIFSPS